MRVVYITNIPAPYQVKFAIELENFFEVEFWFASDNVSAARPGYWNMSLPYNCKMIPQKNLFSYFRSLRIELERFDPDILWLGGGWSMPAWLFVYRWAKKNKKHLIAGPMERSKPDQSLLRRTVKKIVFKTIYRNIDAFLCPGYESYDYFKYLLPKAKTFLFPYAADINEYLNHPVRKVHDKIIFSIGGRMTRQYRRPEVLRVFEKICKKYDNVETIITGDGPERNLCEEIIRSSPQLSKRVFWKTVDSWSDISNFYLEGHIFINYAVWGGWGLVNQETMASGMAVICGAEVSAGRYLMINNYNGFLVRDEDDLYAAMEYYVKNPDMVEEHGRINKIIARKEGFEERAKELNKILKGL